MKNVVVLCGGRSAEHEISLLSAASVLNQLDRTKYRIAVIGIERDGSLYVPELLRQRLGLEDVEDLTFPEGDHLACILARLKPVTDIVFPVLHGPYGEDGTIQGLFEIIDVAYVGAGVCASALGMDKIQSKRLLLAAGLPVLPFATVNRSQWGSQPELLSEIESRLDYPMFVKPSNLGSSVGINKSKNREDLQEHVSVAFHYDDFVIVEQGIDAREIEASVLGNETPRVSIAGEIIPSREFYSYEAKYVDQSSRLLIPAPLTDTEMERIRDLALRTYEVLQLEGMARVDFLMDRHTSEFWINEPNTIPGFTQISMYPKLWEASGLAYPDLLDELISLGLGRHQRRRHLSSRR
ncbi:MAG: D-alanine--D-alanine ligase [Acidobacteria bacterium]|nr:D-alanine--D-alanine ligase [Acidobacteriota bacterium]